MKDYAVISISGSQHLVAVGEKIVVDRESLETGKTLEVNHVLLVRTGESVIVGTPYLEKYPVTLEVLGDQKGEKIKVFKYKAKSRYRKTRGFRAQQTILLVKSIGSSTVREKEEAKPVRKAVKRITKKTTSKLKSELE